MIFVITGASRGIGFELAKQALAMGHQVFAGARKATLEIRDLAEGGKLKFIELDVQSDKSVANFRDKLGVDHVDVLINNAGVYGSDDTKVAGVPVAQVMDTFNTNVLGPLRVTQAMLPLLARGKNSRIANISSLMGSLDDNTSGGALAYRMSKTALNMLTKNLSVEEKKIITLSLHPGWVATAMGGANAPLKPEASAQGLLKVILEAAAETSGKFINYSGKELPW